MVQFDFLFSYHTAQQERFRSGELADLWYERYGDVLFDKEDLRLAKSQPQNHFFEWLAAVLLHEATGYRSLIEKYTSRNHLRKIGIFKDLVGPDFCDWAFANGAGFPDLFVYHPHSGDWFFAEVKGGADRERAHQTARFMEISNRCRRTVRRVGLKALQAPRKLEQGEAAIEFDVPVAGIDVGGPEKGFHAVGLGRGAPRVFSSTSASQIAKWCEDFGAVAVGVDAPCGWSTSGMGRPCERELMAEQISSFLTPTFEIASSNPAGFYGWMLTGAQLYKELARRWTMYSGNGERESVLFETYPYAVERAFLANPKRQNPKTAERRWLLARLGVNTASLSNGDYIDAALCALTAAYFLCGHTKDYGDAASGLIVVPVPTAKLASAGEGQVLENSGPR